ncbi:MAG: hypothetical protein RLZZ86_781 [Cyanobacteriota bacterium]|jgi:hypothetical protein
MKNQPSHVKVLISLYSLAASAYASAFFTSATP